MITLIAKNRNKVNNTMGIVIVSNYDTVRDKFMARTQLFKQYPKLKYYVLDSTPQADAKEEEGICVLDGQQSVHT